MALIFFVPLVISLLSFISTGRALEERSSQCVFDPANPTQAFQLLDPSDGMPFLNVDGCLEKADTIVEKRLEYRFVPVPKFDHNVHDIRLDSAYLAVFDTGRIGFVNESSDGDEAVHGDGISFTTTVFSVSCEGTISLRLPQHSEVSLAYHAPSRGIFARPESSAPRSRNSHSFFKRKSDEFKFIDSWEPFNFLAGPSKISDFYQIGGGPRCPKHPFGLEAFVEPGARPAFFNGCGAENGMKVPDLQFTDCCNQHDLCYDDCSMRWEACNNNFRTCMHSACREKYKYVPVNASELATNSTTWTEWGCNNLADTYAGFVDTGLGSWAFSNSNYDRCDCACPRGTMNCTDICLRDCDERCDVIDCSTTTPGSWWPWGTAPSTSAPLSKSTSLLSTLTTTTESTTTVTPSTAKPTVGSLPSEQDDTDNWWWPSWGGDYSSGSVLKYSIKSPGTSPYNEVTTYWWWPFK